MITEVIFCDETSGKDVKMIDGLSSVPNKGAYTIEFTSENNANPLTPIGMVHYKGIVKVKFFIMQPKVQSSTDQ